MFEIKRKRLDDDDDLYSLSSIVSISSPASLISLIFCSLEQRASTSLLGIALPVLDFGLRRVVFQRKMFYLHRIQLPTAVDVTVMLMMQ